MLERLPVPSIFRSPALCHALLLGAAVTAAGPVAAEPFSANYQVYFGGLHVLNAEAQWELGPSGYHVSAEAKSDGFIGWLSPWQGTTESRGQFVDGKPVPEHHESWATDDDAPSGERVIEMSYDGTGDLATTLVQPEQDFEDRVPLPADAGKGTVDPISVIAGLAEALQAGGRCEGTFPVFDGQKRYDVIVSDAGDTVLAPSDYSIYAGPAHGCRLNYKMLGGQRKQHNKYVETSQNRIVWVARPTEDAPPIPVRLEIQTEYGSLMGHLTGFTEGPQVQAKLPD